jgi:hypothetical protein
MASSRTDGATIYSRAVLAHWKVVLIVVFDARVSPITPDCMNRMHTAIDGCIWRFNGPESVRRSHIVRLLQRHVWATAL